VAFLELKSQQRKVTYGQRGVLALLAQCNTVVSGVVRPIPEAGEGVVRPIPEAGEMSLDEALESLTGRK